MSDNKYKYASLKELYEHELLAKNVSQSDILFVLSLITESNIDEGLCRMENDYWKKLQERELLDIFEEINRANNILWNHMNDPQ